MKKIETKQKIIIVILFSFSFANAANDPIEKNCDCIRDSFKGFDTVPRQAEDLVSQNTIVRSELISRGRGEPCSSGYERLEFKDYYGDVYIRQADMYTLFSQKRPEGCEDLPECPDERVLSDTVPIGAPRIEENGTEETRIECQVLA